jgi:acetate kinase
MNNNHPLHILTINSGSSSLKVGLHEIGDTERQVLVAQVDRIGRADSTIEIINTDGTTRLYEQRAIPDQNAALRHIFNILDERGYIRNLHALGHRVVHGGRDYHEPQLITLALIDALTALVPLDPDHLPQALHDIETARQFFPKLPQVACFDTAFHRTLPRIAQMYALPRHFYDEGVQRYGFHGLSYEYVVQQLRALNGGTIESRVIIAHLGNGASMAALRDGQSIDTSMGFTPVAGLVMGMRSGDLDPGVLLYLQQTCGMSTIEINDLINRQSGLLGMSEMSSDMRDLLAREATDTRAADAIALFCYQARKYIGAYVAVLEGLDALVFTGGIGEHAAPIRARICTNFEYLGLELDPQRNAANAAVISTDASRVVVRAIPTDEDLMIARHTYAVVTGEGVSHVAV